MLLVILGWSGGAIRADDTSVYAVLVTANVEESPVRITLNWEQDPDPYADPTYTVYRKAWGDIAWGTGTSLGDTLTYVDTDVVVGMGYEYQIVKKTSLGYDGYGYIYTGIRVPTVPDSRGKVILVVDRTVSTSLAAELARLELDLTGDGWSVIRHDVERDDESTDTSLESIGLGSAENQANAEAIRNAMIADYREDPGNVKAAFLFGRVPIFRSGDGNIDGHLARPMPADGFYGEMDGMWTTETTNFPSDVDLEVGRVDLSRMPGQAVFNGPVTFPSELELLRQYLRKDHDFRHGRIEAQRRAIVGEGFGLRNGEAFGASGWRNFAPFFGISNIVRAPLATTPGSWQELVCDTANTGSTFLWAEGDGAGSPTSMGGLGTHGQYLDVWTRDLVGVDANGNRTSDIKAVFTMFFGSFLGEWDRTDDLLRGVLASRTMGLTASWSGRPHHYYHHMGLGETVGYGMKVTMNNDSTLYKNQVQDGTRGIHIGLMGDPTLRMHPVKPVADLVASGSETIDLSWAASDEVRLQGYNVYRSASRAGPFTRLNQMYVSGTTYSDAPPAGTYTYMVRAVKLEEGSGTYLNMSQGIFVTAATTGGGIGNAPPSVSAGPDRSVADLKAVVLSGLVSDDGFPNPPSATTAMWSKVSGPGLVSFEDAGAPETEANFSLYGSYTLRLTGNDGAMIASDEVVVTVNPSPGNQSPVVDAGADQAVPRQRLVNLAGIVTDDGIPHPSPSVVWSVVSGPGSVAFGELSEPATTAAFSVDGAYVLRLTADDGELTASDDVVVTAFSIPGNGEEFPVDSPTLALYHFNGNYDDASGNGYHLIPTGGVARTDSNLTWMGRPAGESVRFSNLGDALSVSLPDRVIMDSPTSEVSIEARIFLRSYLTNFDSPNASLIQLSQDYDAGLVLWDSRYHHPPGVNLFGASDTVVVPSSEWNMVALNAWHDLLITFDANDVVECFLDGRQIGSTTSTSTNRGRTGDWNLKLGDFDGDIDEVRISSEVRSPSRILGVSYGSWQVLHFSGAERLDPQISGPNADPERDGLSNLLEYALSLDPRAESKFGAAVDTETVGGRTYLRLQYKRPAKTVDLLYEPQVSSDLENWTADVVELSRIANPDQTETVIVRDTIPIEDAPWRFIRMKVDWTAPD
jgi:hypothetical protein